MHTLNEQLITSAPGADLAETEQNFIDKLVEITGWERDPNDIHKLFLGKTKKISITFEIADGHIQVANNTSTGVGFIGSDGLYHQLDKYNKITNSTNGINIYYHRSKGDTVTYLRFGEGFSLLNRYLIAEDESDMETIFLATSSGASFYYGNQVRTSAGTIKGVPGSDTNTSWPYSIARYVNLQTGVPFKELYWAYNCPVIYTRNCLANFNGSVFRFPVVNLYSSTDNSSNACYRFAFPVEEGPPDPEPEPSTP